MLKGMSMDFSSSPQYSEIVSFPERDACFLYKKHSYNRDLVSSHVQM